MREREDKPFSITLSLAPPPLSFHPNIPRDGGRNLFHYSEVRLFVRLLPQRNEKVVAKWNKSYLVKMRVEFHLKRPFRQDVVCEMRGCTRCDGESNSSLATGAVTRYSSHSLAVVGDAVCFLKGEERGGRADGLKRTGARATRDTFTQGLTQGAQSYWVVLWY